MTGIKNYSDTMIGAMLSALTRRGSDGRYQVLTRGSTRTALAARGAVELEETTDDHGRPVGHWYLTPAALRNLRNGLVLMMGGSTSNATKMHREFVRSGWREAEAAARLILGDFEGAKLVTTTRNEGRPHVVELGPADTISQLANILSNGQHVAECDTGIDGNEPAGRLVAYLGGAVGAETVFHIKRPAACSGCGAPAGEPCVDPLLTLVADAASGPRPAAEVLAADPIPADTPVWDGMPGEAIGSHGVRASDALTDEAYVVQLRSERVWMLPNHDDGAHMTRADVLSALARVRKNAPTAARSTVDADGTVYVSDGRQAARYLPVRLFADYSADFCPGCDTPYAVNGDGPCSGGRSPLAPGSRDYDAEAAELLGDGERWVRHWYNNGQESGTHTMSRAEALQTVILGLRRGEARRADEGGVRVGFDHGSSYWLEPVTEEQHDRADDGHRALMEAGHSQLGELSERWAASVDADADRIRAEREAAELLGEGAQWLRHWRRGEDAAVIPVDREGALNIITLALRAGDWTTGRRDGGVTLVSPTGESSYWLQPVPPAEDAGELSDVWQVKDNDGAVLGHVRGEIFAEAKRAADKLLGRPEGRGGGFFLRRLTVAQEEARQARQAEAEEAVNLAVNFLPQDPTDEDTRPCVEVGTVQVYAYRQGGRLVVSVDLDGVDTDGDEIRADGTVPMVITVQGKTVFEG